MSATRRSFLALLLTAAAGPSIVRADSLMKLAPPPCLWGDGIHDDTAALSYWLSRPDFQLVGGIYLATAPVTITNAHGLVMRGAKFLLGKPLEPGRCLLELTKSRNVVIGDCYFDTVHYLKPRS